MSTNYNDLFSNEFRNASIRKSLYFDVFLFSLLSTGCRTDVEVKLLAGVQHVSFRAYHQHGRQTDVGREIGILDGYHTLQVGTFRVCEFIS